MTPAFRLGRELRQLFRTLSPNDFLRYLGCLLVTIPSIVRSRKLEAADQRMRGQVTAYVAGIPIHVPLSEPDDLPDNGEKGSTFGGVREMYAANIYLSPFDRSLTARTVVDLGANRGLFMILAAKVLNAAIVIGVEPMRPYDPVFKCLARANGLVSAPLARVSAMVSATPGTGNITMDEILQRYALSRINFLKCDIEGAEFEVFSARAGFLDRVDNIAMELHRRHGDAGALKEVLEQRGFALRITDQFGGGVAPNNGIYLYASRTGQLIPG